MNKKGENYLKWRIHAMHPSMQLNEVDGKYTETLDGARLETINDLGDLFFIFAIMDGVLTWVWISFLNNTSLTGIISFIFGMFIGMMTYLCVKFVLHIKDLLNPNENFIKIYFRRKR